LENLLGFDIHSADHVVPEWQQLKVGDEVRLAATVGPKAAIVEPGRALVLQGQLPLARRPPFDSTWAFILCEQRDGTTRLLSRERYGYKRWWARSVTTVADSSRRESEKGERLHDGNPAAMSDSPAERTGTSARS
jgi:hypothetical protein